MTAGAIRFIVLFALSISATSATGLDTTTFVVIGDGLAAGMSDVGLSERLQQKSFGALLAQQMGTIFPQAGFQAPGSGDVPGEPRLPVLFPAYPQSTVRRPFPPSLFVFDISIPGIKLTDVLSRRPALPLIQSDDSLQTLINMIVGFPSLILDRDVPLWTPVEYAVAMNPTLALVELGYYDAIDAAVAGDPARMPEIDVFRSNYDEVVRRLRANFSQVIVTTIPDPTATAYFSSIPAAAARLQQAATFLENRFGLGPGDLLTEAAVRDISTQLLLNRDEPLPPGRILRAADATRIRDRVLGWNLAIAAVARERGALLYALGSLFTRLRLSGLPVAGRTLTAESFGGFFSLDGFHPGATGHALIANEILELLNLTFQRNFPLIKVEQTAQDDPVFAYRP